MKNLVVVRLGFIGFLILVCVNSSLDLTINWYGKDDRN